MISAEDIYQRAKHLSQSDIEIKQREYLKTAYYAVLHRIEEVCNEQNVPITTRQHLGFHEHIIDRIHTNFIGKRICTIARNMKKLRTKADYMLNEDILQIDIQQQTRWLEECWHYLSKFEYK